MARVLRAAMNGVSGARAAPRPDEPSRRACRWAFPRSADRVGDNIRLSALSFVASSKRIRARPRVQVEKAMSRTSRALVAAVVVAIIAAAAANALRPKLAPPAGTPAATTHLNPNRATEAQLLAVPGLTPARVRDVLGGRPYPSQSAFHKTMAPRTAPAQLPAVYAAVFVPISLNNASRDDILLIPGMTRRMAHEFEEYRPYKDLAQFDREIGKYVDQTELARLRSYVTLP